MKGFQTLTPGEGIANASDLPDPLDTADPDHHALTPGLRILRYQMVT